MHPEADVICVYGQPDLDELSQWKGRVVVLDEEAYKAQPQKTLEEAAWQCALLQVAYLQRPGTEEIFKALADVQRAVNAMTSDYGDRGLNILKNVLRNLDFYPSMKLASSLFGAYKGVPAVICGAGASLEKHRAELKELEGKALIFAGGAGLSALSRLGIKPHFAGGVDPHEPGKRLIHTSAPLFFQSRIASDWLKGEKLWVEGSGTIPMEEWIAGRLGLSTATFDGGWNVATFLSALAARLGCSPIILVGVDLSSTKPEGDEWIEWKKGHFTKADWLLAAEWLGEFAKEHTLQTASEGLPLENIPALKEWPHEPVAIRHPEPEASGITHGEVQALKKEIFASFSRVKEECLQLLKIMERYFPLSPHTQPDYLLHVAKIETEVAYKAYLEPIWRVWKYLLMRDNPPEWEGGELLHQWLFMIGLCDESLS